jgi:hypothetical protein
MRHRVAKTAGPGGKGTRPPPRGATTAAARQPQRAALLCGVSGVAPAGRLTALMGPSGSGKSTLLGGSGNRHASAVVQQRAARSTLWNDTGAGIRLRGVGAAERCPATRAAAPSPPCNHPAAPELPPPANLSRHSPGRHAWRVQARGPRERQGPPWWASRDRAADAAAGRVLRAGALADLQMGRPGWGWKGPRGPPSLLHCSTHALGPSVCRVLEAGWGSKVWGDLGSTQNPNPQWQ